MPSLFHLRISNFKKIKLIDVDLEAQGNHVTIVGKNDSGKTSFLDAISFLFGGAPFKPEMPIRIGAEVCQIMGRLSNGLIFKRRVTDTTEKFTIESDDGMSYKSPQSVSDALWNPIAFEPDAFSRLDTKKQAAMLRQITGVDTSLLDSRRKTLYAERTKVNAVYESMAAQVDAIVIPVPPTEIGEEIDIAAISKKRTALANINTQNDMAREELEREQTSLKKMQADIARLKASLEKMVEGAVAKGIEVDAMAESVKVLADHNLEAFDTEIETANEKNAIVRGNIQKQNEHKRAIEQKTIAEQNAKRRKDEADKLTEDIKKIDADKAAMLAKAKFPVEGMSVEEDEVFVNGVPFSQIASSEQTRIGMAMAMAQKSMQSDKAIKICLIRDGDRIGEDKRAVIQEWAKENKVVVFEERVERPGVVGIEIEDGHLRGVDVSEDADKEAVVSAPDGKLVEAEPPKKTRRKKSDAAASIEKLEAAINPIPERVQAKFEELGPAMLEDAKALFDAPEDPPE